MVQRPTEKGLILKKGTTWYFGYKAHVGVAKDTGLIHTVEVTVANTHDVVMTSKLLTGDEESIYGDIWYLGTDKREDSIQRNLQGRSIRYRINRRPYQISKKPTRAQGQLKHGEHEKSSIRAKTEHVFLRLSRVGSDTASPGTGACGIRLLN